MKTPPLRMLPNADSVTPNWDIVPRLVNATLRPTIRSPRAALVYQGNLYAVGVFDPELGQVRGHRVNRLTSNRANICVASCSIRPVVSMPRSSQKASCLEIHRRPSIGWSVLTFKMLCGNCSSKAPGCHAEHHHCRPPDDLQDPD